MTETDWLKGKSADLMLDFLGDRLAPRQWRFLTCGLVRRVGDLLPDGPLTEVIDWVELHADETLKAKDREKRTAKLQAAVETAAAHVEEGMRAIVKAADPDSGNQPPGSAPDPDSILPSRLLFDAASRHAFQAVTISMTAARSAAQAAMNVLLDPGEESFGLVQEQVQEALAQKNAGSEGANNALKLKATGDEFADNYNPRNVRLDRSKAVAYVNKIEENFSGADPERAERSIRKHVAKLLHEIVGNPFRKIRFEDGWRTADAKALAKGIFDDRAFDRLPILADALLDADCDEEALLRHCRGTELHLKELNEAQPHSRGCWVVELVLGRWQPLKPPKPSKAKKPKVPDWLNLDFDEPGLSGGGDRFA